MRLRALPYLLLMTGTLSLAERSPAPQNPPAQPVSPARAVGVIIIAPGPAAPPSAPAAVDPEAQPSISPQAAGDLLWEQFQAAAWESAYTDWRRAQGEAACRPFSAEERDTPDALWAYRCPQRTAPLSAESLFYAFTADDPPIARLEQFRASIAGVPPAVLEQLRQKLADRLTTSFGAGEEPDRRKLFEFGSAFWQNVLRWQTRDLQVYLYLKGERGQASSVEIIARRRALLDALAESRKVGDFALGRPADAGAAFEHRLAQQLDPGFSGVFGLLAASAQKPGQQNSEIVAALLRVLEAAKSAPPDRVAPFLLTADRLADRLLIAERESAQGDVQRQRLAGYGLGYEYDELGGAWAYTHGLLWRVWRDYGSTVWGEDAFLELQARGWDTRVGCANGSDQFRAVISHGEEYLGGHRQSPARPTVLLALAQAYETWWSLSKAGAGDDYVNPIGYRQDAPAAREKAMEYYQSLLTQGAALDPAISTPARLALPRLKLGLDTAQRRFFCIYD